MKTVLFRLCIVGFSSALILISSSASAFDFSSLWGPDFKDLDSCNKFTARVEGQAALVKQVCAKLFPTSADNALGEKSKGRFLCLRNEVAKTKSNSAARDAVFRCYEKFPVKESKRALEIATYYFPTAEERAAQREAQRKVDRQMEEIRRRIFDPPKPPKFPPTLDIDCTIIGDKIICM